MIRGEGTHLQFEPEVPFQLTIRCALASADPAKIYGTLRTRNRPALQTPFVERKMIAIKKGVLVRISSSFLGDSALITVPGASSQGGVCFVPDVVPVIRHVPRNSHSCLNQLTVAVRGFTCALELARKLNREYSVLAYSRNTADLMTNAIARTVVMRRGRERPYYRFFLPSCIHVRI